MYKTRLFRALTWSYFLNTAEERTAALDQTVSAPDDIARLVSRPLPLALASTARFVHPSPEFGDHLDRVKFAARGLMNPFHTAEWFRILAAPECSELVRNHPHILSKLQRSYLHRKLPVSGRLAALKAHYAFAKTRLGLDPMRQIAGRNGWPLARLDFQEHGACTLRLVYSDRFEKEGDLCIVLRDEESGESLFTLSFCVMETTDDGAPKSIFAGGLQGHPFDDQKNRIVTLTRKMHGLRPKALLVFVLQRLAQIWGAESILTVGDSEHIYRKFGRRREICAQYDPFWIESGGEKMADGNFRLPHVPQTRNVAELPVNKRGMYRKRYAMLAGIGQQLLESVAPGLASVAGVAETVSATMEQS